MNNEEQIHSTGVIGVEEDQIDEVLETLQERGDDWMEIDPQNISLEGKDYGSHTLSELEPRRRPQAKTVCETCPHSVWFSSPTEVKCYCRVMYLVTWSTAEPNTLTNCDGPFLGQE